MWYLDQIFAFQSWSNLVMIWIFFPDQVYFASFSRQLMLGVVDHYSRFWVRLSIIRQNMNSGFWNFFGPNYSWYICTFIWYIIHSFKIILVDTGVSWTWTIFNFLLDLAKFYYRVSHIETWDSKWLWGVKGMYP